LNEQNSQIGDELIEVECHISDTSLFIDLLRKHDGVVFFTVWMDTTSVHGVENIWYEEHEWSLFRTKWIAELNIQLRLVQWSFIREAEVWCFGKARKLWKTGDYTKSKKNILHALRYLLVALQIVDHGKIIDFQCGKDYHEQIMIQKQYTTWEEWEANYLPIFEELKTILKQKVDTKVTTMIQQTSLSKSDTLHVIPFIQTHGLGSLSKYFSLSIFPVHNCIKICRDQPKLILSEEKRQRIYQSIIPRECNRLIMDWNWNVVCLPYYKFMNASDVGADVVDVTSVNIEHKIRGELYCLYWHANEWRVSYDAEEEEWEASVANRTIELKSVAFWKMWSDLAYEYPNERTNCYSFELAGTTLYIHGVRNVKTLQEEVVDEYCERYKWKRFKRPSIERFSDIKSLYAHIQSQHACGDVDLEHCTGFVIRDAQFNRVQIKYTFYECLFSLHIWDNNPLTNNNPYQSIHSQHNENCVLTMLRSLTSQVLGSKQDEEAVLAYKPLFAQMYLEMKTKYLIMCEKVEATYNTLAEQVGNDTDSDKKFAMEVNKKKLQPKVMLFLMRKTKVSSLMQVLYLQSGLVPDDKQVYNLYKTFNN
jgi:hypothetical protein